jgi:alpha-ribazole phosphatase/probable phosphoglycerate mutase
MTRFYIVRHGETAWNADGRIQGHTDVELTQAGIEQARLAAERLGRERIDSVYSSDLKRAAATAEIIAAPHGLKVATTPLLREAFLGEWQGLTMQQAAEEFVEEYAAYVSDSIANRPPGGERLEDVIARCSEFLSQAAAEHPAGRVAVAAHGGSARGIIAAAFGLGPEVWRRIRLDNGGLTVLEIDRGRPLLVLLNDTISCT